MRLWPTESETLVLPAPADRVLRLLRNAIQPPASQNRLAVASREGYLFNGKIDGESFCLSQKITRPNNFLPLIVGTIDPTSQGCLVFVRYRLFNTTRLFLAFWSVVSVGFAIYLAAYEHLYGYAAFSVGIGTTNYLVATLNFRRQVGISQRLLRQVLDPTTEFP